MRFPYKPAQYIWKSQAARDFILALLLLGVSLYLGLLADSAARRGESRPGIILSILSLSIALTVALTLVPRLARRVKFSRWLMPVSFSITREGGIYILAIFLLSLAAINTGNNLLFLIMAILLSAIVASGSFARASLRSIRVSIDIPENVFVDEHISIKVSLHNAKRILPSFSISVEDAGCRAARGRRRLKDFWMRPGAGNATQEDTGRLILRHAAYFPALLAGETCSLLIGQSFPARGKYTLQGFRLSTCFPFGFFKRGERVRAEGEILVYPRIDEVSAYFHLLPFLPGHLEGRHVGLGESLYALRKYRDGESARRVDWKATAKTGELMAREYAREEESRFCLILDNRIQNAEKENCTARFEKSVSLAASLAAHFTEEGAELEFMTPDEYIPRGMGNAQLYCILRALAVIDCRTSADGPNSDLRRELAAVAEPEVLQQVLSDKVFKIIITSKPRGGFSSSLWRSSHVIYFDEL